MNKIRIGQSFRISWKVQVNKQQVDLSTLPLHLELVNPFGRAVALPFHTDNDTIIVDYAGTEHTMLGTYRLTLYAYKGEGEQSLLDACDAFTLVACTCDSDTAGTDNLQTEQTVELSGNLSVGIRGRSAYEVWLDNGHEGTEEDFVAWLQEPARTAASAALQTEKKVSEAETLRVTAEGKRENAEAARETAEGKREEAERLRMDAEKKRKEAETDRETAEGLRVEEEKKRVTAESGRATEFTRLSSEMTTATDATKEATRLANEATGAANTAADGANKAASSASTATTEAGKATQAAKDATSAAVAATEKADAATTLADAATSNANTAASGANKAATAANGAAQLATTEAGKATQAASSANTAAGRVDTAITEAGKATTAANTATDMANTATGNANKAATAANEAASAANSAASSATTEAGKAGAAATKAEQAAGAATDAVDNLMGYVTEYNVSKHHPTSGIGGSNKFTLEQAVALIPQEIRTVGIKCSFIGEGGTVQTYVYQGGTFAEATAWGKYGEVTEKESLFIDLWNNACGQYGKYNDATGYYELNGITDITYNEALKIYNAKVDGVVRNTPFLTSLDLRTAFPVKSVLLSMEGIARNSWFHVINLCESTEIWIRPAVLDNLKFAFFQCHNLVRIMDVFYFFDGIKKGAG